MRSSPETFAATWRLNRGQPGPQRKDEFVLTFVKP